MNSYIQRAMKTRERNKKIADGEDMAKEFRRMLDEMDDKRCIIIELLREQELELEDLKCEYSEE